MLRFKAITLDGEEIEFNFEDIASVYKEDGVFFLTNQSVNKAPCRIDSVEVINNKKRGE